MTSDVQPGIAYYKPVLIIACVFTFLMTVYCINNGQRLQYIRVKTSATVQQSDVISETPIIQKALFIPYMNAWPSLVGQLFDIFPNTVYWPEPLDPFYSSFAGTPVGSIPLDLTEEMNGRTRNQSEEELTQMTDAVISILSCNVSQMFPSLFTNDNDIAMNETNSWSQEFMSCCKKLQPSTIASCVPILKPICPQNIMEAIDRGCPEGIQAAKQGVPEGHPVWNNDKTRFTAFTSFKNCMEKLRKNMMSCASTYNSACHNAATTVTMVLRMRLDVIDRILQKDPAIHVIQFIRDPRAIMLSRKKNNLLASVTHRNMEEEGAVLCRQMSEDIKVLENLQRKYPKKILVMKYEDFVMNIERRVVQLSGFAGIAISLRNLKEYRYQRNFLRYRSKKEGLYSQQRMNRTNNGILSSSKISPQFKSFMDKTCHNVLLKLKYPL